MPTATPARADHYPVPSMAGVAAVPHNGLTVASTFSGCGGSSLGYRMAGAKVVWASEFIPAAQDTYRTNNPATILDTRDIRTVQPQEVLDAAGLDAGQLVGSASGAHPGLAHLGAVLGADAWQQPQRGARGRFGMDLLPFRTILRATCGDLRKCGSTTGRVGSGRGLRYMGLRYQRRY